MDKEQVFNKMCDGGLIAVVRAKDSEQAIKIAEACKEGGVAGIEITFTVPGADEVIRALAAKYKNGELQPIGHKQPNWLNELIEKMN